MQRHRSGLEEVASMEEGQPFPIRHAKPVSTVETFDFNVSLFELRECRLWASLDIGRRSIGAKAIRPCGQSRRDDGRAT
eukprot:41662-Eustigmatos_ZCMA.PRE.1